MSNEVRGGDVCDLPSAHAVRAVHDAVRLGALDMLVPLAASGATHGLLGPTARLLSGSRSVARIP
jgi:hypothetical protein